MFHHKNRGISYQRSIPYLHANLLAIGILQATPEKLGTEPGLWTGLSIAAGISVALWVAAGWLLLG